MLGIHLSAFVKEDFRSIIKHFRGTLLGVSVLIGFLLFLLNIFLGAGLYAHRFSDQMKDKLGMYFYIKDVPGQEDQTTKDILLMKDELQSQGLTVTYATKEDALSFLQKKIPDVVANFQKFGIDNPLPATLYVMFSNDDQYTALKTVILNHKDIILNIKDIDSGATIKQQENRILTTINFSNVVVTIAYCIIALLLIIVFVFLAFLLKTIFATLHKAFEVKKLLGANHLDVIKSFVMVTLDIMLVAFVICFVLLVVSGIALNVYLMSLFSISLLTVLANIAVLLGIFIGEIIVIGAASIGLAYFFTNNLHKNLTIMK